MSITKHNAKAWAPIIQALADGKELQFNFDVSGWGSAWNIETWAQRPHDYRVKPEPTWRAWNPEEVPRVYVVRPKSLVGTASCRAAFSVLDNEANTGETVIIHPSEHGCQHLYLSPKEMFSGWVRVMTDGTESPCGVLVSQ